MQYLLLMLGLAAAVVLGAQVLARPLPARWAGRLHVLGTVFAWALAALLLARGQFVFAFALLALGLGSLLGGSRWLIGGAAKSPGQISRIETALLRMQLDHDSGAMSGAVLTGPCAGRSLASLSQVELVSLWSGCATNDPRSATLLEAYLDRRFAAWRDTIASPADHGRLSAAEAREILGVGPEASDDDIRAAWREQMKRNHPDYGGSVYLAAKINAAKDVLLRRST